MLPYRIPHRNELKVEKHGLPLDATYGQQTDQNVTHSRVGNRRRGLECRSPEHARTLPQNGISACPRFIPLTSIVILLTSASSARRRRRVPQDLKIGRGESMALLFIFRETINHRQMKRSNPMFHYRTLRCCSLLFSSLLTYFLATSESPRHTVSRAQPTNTFGH